MFGTPSTQGYSVNQGWIKPDRTSHIIIIINFISIYNLHDDDNDDDEVDDDDDVHTHSLTHSVLDMYDDDLKKISSVEEEVDDEDL